MHLTRRCTLAAALAMPATPLFAQQTDRPIRVIVPFAPGGGTDVMMRLIATAAGARLGRSMVVENVAGAGGTIGAMQVVNAQPDGTTLLCGTPGSIAVNPVIQPGIRYHPLRDLTPITQLTDSPIVLVANNDLPVRSVEDLVRIARAQPGVINYGSAGPGSIAHLSGELFCHLARVELTHIPYRGTALSLNDLRANRVQLLFENLPPVLSLIQEGQIRGIAVGTPEPSPFLPGLPTIAATVPGYVSTSYTGLLAPAGTPRDIVQRISAACAEALQDPEVVARLRSLGATVAVAGPDAFQTFVGERLDAMRQLVDGAGLRFS
jgi:tripartite-type tricarboxylate transporter receptor subunit TctC